MDGMRFRAPRGALPACLCVCLLLFGPLATRAAPAAGEPRLATRGEPAPAAKGKQVEKPLIEIEATVDSLENGLKVILVEDHSAPVISYQTFFRVGSRNEHPGITGISHFMEHMMFNGAGKYGPKEFDGILEANGGTSNAYTSEDMTVYYEDIASDGLELVVDLDSDRMKSLALDPKYLESEMGVVMEERLSSIDNSVEGAMEEELSALAFKAHPYKWPVLGWMSDLEAIDRDDCVGYFRTYYAPNNAVLVVSGDFDSAEALALIHRYYDDIPAQTPPAPVRTVEPEQWGERRAEVRKPAELPAVRIGYHVPPMSSDDFYALELLQGILSTGRSSRLYRLLVRELAIAVSVGIDYSWRMDPCLFVFDIKMKPGCATAEAERALCAAIDSVAAFGVTEAELERAKKQIAVDHLRNMQTVNGRAGMIGHVELLLGDFRKLPRLQEHYGAVTADDIKRVAGSYLLPTRRNIVTLVPEGNEG